MLVLVEKLKLEHIDGVARPRSAPKACGHLPAPDTARVRPCARTSACEPHCNISDTKEADGEDVHGQAFDVGNLHGTPVPTIVLLAEPVAV
jgi:hypothetical protein